jgi:hypothetical protein
LSSHQMNPVTAGATNSNLLPVLMQPPSPY